MASNAHATDAMVRRLETELREKQMFSDGIITRAQEAERDLNTDESAALGETRSRMEQIKSQLDQLGDMSRVAAEVANRAKQVDLAISTARGQFNSAPVEYRSAGAYAVDQYRAALGHRDAAERLELFHRAADHQKTSDNPGIIPDPVIGDVISFIDSARPIVSALGPMALPSETWYRPKVTQHTAVGKQGTNGLAADQKTELDSQKMVIQRIPGEAVTYGGYVNVSRQNIDWSSPSAMDLVINDLAAQYAIETEAATADAISAVATAAVNYTDADQDSLSSAVWAATAQVFAAAKGRGRLLLAIAPDRLAAFGPLFAPYGPQNQQGTGFSAGNFGQGVMGTISGIPVVMSAGLATGEAALLSSAALEVFEQRGGTLQVVEPSVLGVQVGYYGYFTAMTINAAGIVPLAADGS